MLQSIQSALINHHQSFFCPIHRCIHRWDWKNTLKYLTSLDRHRSPKQNRRRNAKNFKVQPTDFLKDLEFPHSSCRSNKSFNHIEDAHHRSEVKKIRDLSKPTLWYPSARSINRSIVFHAGPTNSGKTHSALEKFLSSKSGIYCCPLRLLAREVSQKSKEANVQCNLVTGEERFLVDGSKHVACTVEMTDLFRKFDIGVIDEIQIIADADRGWAWTQALLGLQAKEIHVCGEPRAINIVERLCAECGDEFNLQEYHRLTKLRVKKYAVGSIDKVRSGDCIVCFKRKDIYSTISELKKQGRDTAVIYGKLPPSMKRKEAQKFNDPQQPCDVLVATDAVGMGLNLNIKRIVFQALTKGVRNSFGIIENSRLTTPAALQIAGRAGRFGLQESGEVTTLYDKDISVLHELLSNPKDDIKQACLLPTKKHFLKLSSEIKDFNLYRVLVNFREFSKIDKRMYTLSSQRDCLILAKSMQRYPLSISDAYTFSLCPVNYESDISKGMFHEFVRLYSQSKPVTYKTFLKILQKKFLIKFPILAEIEYHKIAVLEDLHNTFGVYLWLSQKFPRNFPDREKVFRLQRTTVDAITLSLWNVRKGPSVQCKKIFKAKTKKLRQKLKPVIFYR